VKTLRRKTIKKAGEVNVQEATEVTEWMKSYANDHGFQILTYHEIVDIIQEEDNSEREEDMKENDKLTSSHSRDFNCLEIAMKWYEKQDECSVAQLLTLKRLLDISAGTQVSSAKQTSLLDFFK
jgi:hypothetical protein